MRPEIVHDASGQGRLGPNQRQANVVVQSPLPQMRQIGDGDVDQVRVFGCTPITGGYKNLLNSLRLRQLPSHGVFTSATSNDQYFHQTSLIFQLGVMKHVLNIVQVFQYIQ